MKKSILLTAVLALGIAGSAFAAPLADYEPGNVAVDLGFSFSKDITGELSGDVLGMGVGSISALPNLGSQTAWNGGVTVGLGGNFALRGGYDYTRLGTFKLYRGGSWRGRIL